MNRKILGLGVIAAVTAGLLVVAVAGAQEGTPTPSPGSTRPAHELYREEFLDKLAENLNVTRDELETAIDDAASATVDDAVANGDIPQDRAEDIKQRIEETDGFGPFFGPGPHHGPGGRHFFFHGDLIQSAADSLGMSVDDLTAELRDGKTIADVAAEKNVSVDDLTADILATAKTDLDQKVADGDLTQEKADEIYSRLSENIGDIINGEGPLHDGPRPFPRFREFFDGDGRPFNNDSGDDPGEGTGTSTSANGA